MSILKAALSYLGALIALTIGGICVSLIVIIAIY